MSKREFSIVVVVPASPRGCLCLHASPRGCSGFMLKMQFCTSCGSQQSKAGAKFCSACGNGTYCLYSYILFSLFVLQNVFIVLGQTVSLSV